MNTFSQDFFINNRIKLINEIPDCLIILSANSMLQYSADEPYPFRQDSSFWYFSGIEEPDAILVIDTSENESKLLLPTLNDYQNLWDGSYDKSEITKISGIKSVSSVDELSKIVKKAKNRKQKIGCLNPFEVIVEPYGFYSNPSRRSLESKIREFGAEPIDIRLEIARIRQQKQPIEIEAIQETINITQKSLENVKKQLSEYNTEQEIYRKLTIEFLKNGGDEHGFAPIIASGANAAIIHYKKNSATVKKNEMLLLDVGVKKQKYASDISRTWSIGKPTKRQKDIHKAVVDIQDYALSLLKPGVYLKDYQKDVEQMINQKMKKLDISNADEKFPHGISHFLGLDIHDSGDYNSPITEGSVLTVEPGIYVPDEGIGVRIEDNVLVTKNGIEILSKNIPREL